MTIFDNGSSEQLCVANLLNGNSRIVMAWNGSSWVQLGGTFNGTVTALAVYDDGTGPSLYACGQFTSVGGIPMGRIAKYQGVAWVNVGSGLDNHAYCMHVFDNGNEPALYVGGFFGNAGGVDAKRIAKWDGSQWTAFSQQLVPADVVYTLTSFDDGTGLALYAGGYFPFEDANVRRWNGSKWTPVGDCCTGTVYMLAVADDGTGSTLYAGGNIYHPAPIFSTEGVVKWNGSSWEGLGLGIRGPSMSLSDKEVRAIATFDSGHGSELYVGGSFSRAGEHTAFNFARWGTPRPVIHRQPVSTQKTIGSSASFAVRASGQQPLTYQWLKDGSPLVDGPTGYGSVITGSLLDQLTISNVQLDDEGFYNAFVQTPECGQVSSSTGALDVLQIGDTNGDAVVNVVDLVFIINEWGPCSAPPSSCNADIAPPVDGDGTVNVLDLLLIINNWG